MSAGLRLAYDRYDAKTDLLRPSLTMFEKPPPPQTRITLEILALLRLVRLDRLEPPESNPRPRRGQIVSSTNLTILNFLLIHFGPLHERTLCLLVAEIQVACSAVAFGIRYGVGAWVYDGERR